MTTPELADLIVDALDSRLLDVFTALPGVVQSYDAATQTATVQPAVKRPLPMADGSWSSEVLPPIQNVPVGHVGGGHFSSHFALSKGDTVLLVFSQWAYSQWRSGGRVSDPLDTRLHGPSYPVALPWFRPNGGPGSDTDDSVGRPGGLRLRFTETALKVGAGADYVALAAKVDADLAALKAALNAIGSAFTAAGGAPLTGTAAGAAVTSAASAVVLQPTASTKLKSD